MKFFLGKSEILLKNKNKQGKKPFLVNERFDFH